MSSSPPSSLSCSFACLNEKLFCINSFTDEYQHVRTFLGILSANIYKVDDDDDDSLSRIYEFNVREIT